MGACNRWRCCSKATCETLHGGELHVIDFFNNTGISVKFSYKAEFTVKIKASF